MGTFIQDLRHAIRSLRKNPGSTAIAILILALGIGANSAIFSILDPLLLRTLPVHKPEELVRIEASGYMGPLDSWEAQAFSLYREKSDAFTGVFSFAPETNYEVDHAGESTTATGEIVSGNYFSVLGIRPFTGRLFALEDEHGGPAVVLGFDYWRRALAADPKIVGQTIPLNNLPYTIVGVAPPNFFGMEIGKSPDFFLPLTATGPTHADWMQILGRLKTGVTISQAQTRLQPLFDEAVRNSLIPKIETDEVMTRLELTDASRGFSEQRGQFSLPVRILMGVIVLVLLIACANVANLLLARAAARRRELSVRQALGAGRWRLVQPLFLESLLLIIFAAIGGVLARSWIRTLLMAALSSQRLPFALASGFDFRVFLFTFATLAVMTLLCGLSPAWHATRLELTNDLKVQAAATPERNQSRLAGWLVLAQVALSMTVLFGTSLLLHSLVNLETFDAGFDRDHVLIVSMSVRDKLPLDRAVSFNQRFVERVNHLPGVRSVSSSAFSPLSGHMLGVNLAIEGYSLRPDENAHALFSAVSPTYFRTLGIPMLEGRDFTWRDVQNPPHAVVINRYLARRFFGDASPLGRHLQIVEGNHPPAEIVGVVADSKYNDLRETDSPFFYLPSSSNRTFEIRFTGMPKPIEMSLPAVVHSLDSSIYVTSIQTMRAQVDESIHFDRVIAMLCAAFGLLALALTCIGIYGTLSFQVVRRTREIGIRMALGAHRQDIFRLVIGRGLILTVAGALIGVGGGVATTFLLRTMLFNVKVSDPFTLIAVPTLLLCFAFAASYIPAWKASSVEPMHALRME